MSKKVVSNCETSAVNFMVGCYEFACSMKCSISSLFVSHKQNTSSMNLFHVSGLLTLCLKISFSIDAMKMKGFSCPNRSVLAYYLELINFDDVI